MESDTPPSKFHLIGRGACGTVWAATEAGPAYKREDGNPARSLTNDYEMHQRVLQSHRTLTKLKQKSTEHPRYPQIQIPACHSFIQATDQWWITNLGKFPPEYSPCNTLHSQRIPPFNQSTRELLIHNFCADELKSTLLQSIPDRDCLVRLYLGRHRTHVREYQTPSRFRAFSLRNFPLHANQLVGLGVPTNDVHKYAETMAETLAMMHWIAGVDGNDVEIVLAAPNDVETNDDRMSNVLGDHSMWLLDFDLCRDMAMDEQGGAQAVNAFWGNDPYYPRPGRDLALWSAFRTQYLKSSDQCLDLCDHQEGVRRRLLPRLFIELLERQGM
ncbi:hypothetical protein N7457_007526 [Penicillium paradoxum]|uniref:uncharacterized protein n=1 Tax=Penicillium paradoxum TaxID=176176 RepID=UPI002547241C|nr:uncharacterized protein N7457_007526 [Penicillium paradoxum]KAJ5779806.1 hypothetical protein N7457_007526 [Penicillium paradoxum]